MVYIWYIFSDIRTTDRTCQVEINSGSETESADFEYILENTPTIRSVSPRRGGTGGGTDVTIIGTNFE